MTKSDFLATCFWTPAYSKINSQACLWTARQCHSICMPVLGFCSFLGRNLSC